MLLQQKEQVNKTIRKAEEENINHCANLLVNEKSRVPRATEFMVSMVDMPVCIISSGYSRAKGFIGWPEFTRLKK
jgi:cysteinyl-tRNA synthetase